MPNPIPSIEPVPPCVTPACTSPSRWKGLCSRCYGQAKQLIDAGETTWEELAQLKLCIIPDSPFVAAFKAARAKVTEPLQ